MQTQIRKALAEDTILVDLELVKELTDKQKSSLKLR